MNHRDIDNLLVAAAPTRRSGDTRFVKDVMNQITPTKKPKQSWLTLLQKRSHLHGPAFAVAAIAVATLFCGVVYAAIHFAPAFIEILGKDTNKRGQPQYTVGAFADCATNTEPIDKFEVKKGAPALSDEEIKKIVQARCELQWVSDFVKTTWPIQEHDATTTYARAETVAQLQSINESGISITYQSGGSQLNTQTGHKLEAYTSGKKIQLDELKPGDAVFPVVRVAEKNTESTPTNTSTQHPDPRWKTGQQPEVLGLIAVLKMSLPYEYYQTKQGYITEVRSCYGNDAADCPNTASIDVYPRAGGEGATNTFFDKSLETAQLKQVTGTVTEFAANRVTIASSNGEQYTIQLADTGFADYNTVYAPAYNTPEALVKVSSTLQVTYKQAESSTTISAGQILRINLLLEMVSPKKDPIKQY